MKEKAKTIFSFSIVAICLTLVCCCELFFEPYMRSQRQSETLSREKTKYSANEEGTRIENIPFSSYISQKPRPKGSLVPDLRKDASGEENAEKINKAISTLSNGGTVYIKEGEYKVSTIVLKSNITLFVSKGAKLVSLSCEENESSNAPLSSAVIFASNAQNVKICGGGTINGNGESYTNEPKAQTPFYALKEFNLYTRVIQSRKRLRTAKDTQRNNVICLENCKNVKIENIVLENSATWTCKLDGCDGVEIENTVIDNNLHTANADGFDICSSSNVKIDRCFVATADDAIVIKTPSGEAKNISVSNCVATSFANCFKIGTETCFDVENVEVENCEFFMPSGITGGYSGIAVESADGANVKNVKIKNISMDGVSSPILIWLGNRLKFDKKEVGSIDGVEIENIWAKNTELPSAITGCKNGGKLFAVENVTFKNVTAEYRNTGENLNVKRIQSDSSMSGYPEITRISHRYFISHELSRYNDLPCYSLFVRYAKNVDFSDYKTTPRKCSTLSEFYLREVS